MICVWASYKKKFENKFFCILKINEVCKESDPELDPDPDFIRQRYGSGDPNPHQICHGSPTLATSRADHGKREKKHGSIPREYFVRTLRLRASMLGPAERDHGN
jgi:hypothetical protein